ncbi:hypothetical protein [Pontibacter roseus]|uniref:hypothetical protein n=1 Tax=Pontibacter roseus TaxID=336989 RepID=UPI000370A0F6|nr:hypothetical protein [Pontibacter roseus]
MKPTGRQVLTKLNVLLAVLLCSVLAYALPVAAQAAAHPEESVIQKRLNTADEAPLVLLAGKCTSGEEGILQLDKSLLLPLFYSLLQKLYAGGPGTATAPNSYPASRGDCGLHTIFTKGP